MYSKIKVAGHPVHPVLAHRPDAGNGLHAARRIVAGVDGSAAAAAALAWAAAEARLRRAELVAVYAWDGAERPRALYAPRDGLPGRTEAQAAAAALLSTAVRAVFGHQPPPGLRTEVAEGRPEQVLPGRAAGAEMLVLGCTRRVRDSPAPPGPVHRACLHSAPCPVAIVGCLPEPVPARRDLRHPAAEAADARSAALLGEIAGASPQRHGKRRPAGRPRVPSVTAR